jgi:RHS repeat-associated protein
VAAGGRLGRAGLTQVLSDGSNNYLYGNGRIAQDHDVNMGYFLGDALVSVRQLTNDEGAVTLTQSYEPYGEVLSSEGTGTSIYGFDAEQTEANGLVFLRARYYRPINGQFTNRDPAHLDDNQYLYAAADPINNSDPSGLFSTQQIISSMKGGSLTFGQLMQMYNDLTDPLAMINYRKWGFFSALLDADDGDSIQLGAPIIMTLNPYIKYTPAKKLTLINCENIMVGNKLLYDYVFNGLTYPIGDFPMIVNRGNEQFWDKTASIPGG